jgi:hypothetical protein
VNDAKIIERSVEAKAVLESAIYQEAWTLTREAIIAKIEATPLSDKEVAEDLRRCLLLIKSVRGNLEAIMKAGRLAEFRLVQEQLKPEQKVHLFKP